MVSPTSALRPTWGFQNVGPILGCQDRKDRSIGSTRKETHSMKLADTYQLQSSDLKRRGALSLNSFFTASAPILSSLSMMTHVSANLTVDFEHSPRPLLPMPGPQHGHIAMGQQIPEEAGRPCFSVGTPALVSTAPRTSHMRSWSGAEGGAGGWGCKTLGCKAWAWA